MEAIDSLPTSLSESTAGALVSAFVPDVSRVSPGSAGAAAGELLQATADSIATRATRTAASFVIDVPSDIE